MINEVFQIQWLSGWEAESLGTDLHRISQWQFFLTKQLYPEDILLTSCQFTEKINILKPTNMFRPSPIIWNNRQNPVTYTNLESLLLETKMLLLPRLGDICYFSSGKPNLN